MRFAILLLLTMCCFLQDSTLVVAQPVIEDMRDYERYNDYGYDDGGGGGLEGLVPLVFFFVLIGGGCLLFHYIRNWTQERANDRAGPKTDYLRGNNCLRKQKYHDAISWYTKSLEKGPYWVKYGDSSAWVLSNDEYKARAFYGRGMAYEALGDMEKAAADFANAEEWSYEEVED